MVRAKTGRAAQELESLWASGTLTGMSDAQLLVRFSADRDSRSESAFRELITRHGPMVMGVCRQILRRPHDADDAFQATFLVLVRKARSIQVRDSLGPWLHGVAYRTALRARATASRYLQADWEPADTGRAQEEHAFELDLRPLLQEELGRLPEKYRAPIVLCHLEGKSHEEAARMLEWPVGTVSGRLSRGRELLRSRLERRGVAVPSALLSANWLAGTSATVPPALLESTVGAALRLGAAAAISSSVLTLTQGVLNAMLFHKLRLAAAVILIAGCITGSAGVWAYHAGESSPPVGQAGAPALPKPSETEQATASAPNPGGAQVAPDQPKGPFGVAPRGPGGAFARDQLENLNNAPNVTYFAPYFHSGSIVLVESPDRRTLRALSLASDTMAWQEISLPPGITVIPVSAGDVLALAITAKSIDHVAAFSALTGEWVKQHLRKPVEGSIKPIVSTGCAVYQAGNDVYAFSSNTGTWGALHLEGDEKPMVTVSTASVAAIQGNKVYIFPLKQGKWSKGVEANLRPFATDPRPEQAKKGRDSRAESRSK
jgi:RNA polymerase sigma factor (sigma-70 family)